MSVKKFKGKFVGPYKIEEISLSSEKTYLGKPKVVLTFENNKTQELPLEVLQSIVTKTKSDLTELREKKVKPVVEKILIILVESELGQTDLNYAIGPKLTESLNQSFRLANEALWGREKDDVTLMDVEKVLRKKNEQQKKNHS